ncbi:MAG TPA: HD domain-containing protein [Trueperaceae bacterium]|nr:HD domain-containing protein [Trueperaceae bacterium]
MDDAERAPAENGGEDAAGHLLATALRAYRLKDEPRQGWVLRAVSAPESVAAHAWGTALLCLLFAEEAGVDRERALTIATVHDLAEAEIGDIPARAHPADRSVHAAEKARLEADGLERLLAGRAPEVDALWREYEAGVSAEARFVRDMNLLDMALQALLYEEQARYDPSETLPSQDGYRHLDEFLVSAEARVQGPLARRLLGWVALRYRRARERG